MTVTALLSSSNFYLADRLVLLNIEKYLARNMTFKSQPAQLSHDLFRRHESCDVPDLHVNATFVSGSGGRR
jgi:hypothetical protein